MKDPVSGVFRATGSYNPHPHSSNHGLRVTGVIVADGVPPTPVEIDSQGKWGGRDELPVTVDRADPNNFRVEWDQIAKPDYQAIARQRALDEATRLAGGVPAMDVPLAGPGTGVPGAGLGMGFPAAGAFGDVGARIERAMRAAGMDPGMLSSPNGAMSPDRLTAAFATMAGASVPATGVVRAVHDLPLQFGMTPGMSLVDVTVDVQRPDGSTYSATTRIGFATPERRAAVATVGTTLPLLLNPNDPSRLVVDTTRMNLP